MGYLTAIEMSKEWRISSRRKAVLCGQNRINGVIKKEKTLLILQCSARSEDERKYNHSLRGAQNVKK